MAFPSGFTWGVATASYQIEGSPARAGGGESVWDMFCRREGAVHAGESGLIACDHYHRYREDVALMKRFGIQAYRMSIAWPRVLPDGEGCVHDEGLAFYDRLVDELLAAGIEPYITLFHWDLPLALYYRGGWLNRDIVGWFGDYTQVVVDKLGDRVSAWMTLNEPQCFIGLGQQTAQHAPGDRLGMEQLLLASHHALLAHGASAQIIRARAKPGARVGWAPVGVTYIPASDSPEDVEAAREATWSVTGKNVWNNTWWDDPVFFGKYPEDGLALFGRDVPEIRPGDMETIHQPPDFFGANIYNGTLVRRGDDGKPQTVSYRQGIGRTTYQWPVTPECLYWGPKFAYERYQKPIVITENGLGCVDWPHLDGQVHDPARIDFLARHLREFHRAHQDGVPIDGYFQWSFLDNFEWNEGYRQRFGLVYVDYETQERIPKDSAEWYAGVIASNGSWVCCFNPE
ncbi:MAG TPA: GH1 family beta-glucosidase [Fimbriimonadaceae bacterium]|nr:GH1 family beta-glucosidase [Fimbriimonadaceae bacterium]